MEKNYSHSIVIISLIIIFNTFLLNAQIKYKVIDLGTLGGNVSAAFSINDSGQVVGYSRLLSGNNNAFFWNNNVMTAIVTPGIGSVAIDINNNGAVLGYFGLQGDGDNQAFKWKSDAQLANLGGNYVSGPWMGINDNGTAVGITQTKDNAGQYLPRAVRWVNNTLEYLFTNDTSSAFRINNLGQIVGQIVDQNGPAGFLWENGNGTKISNLRNAIDINDNGEILGESSSGGHYVIWKSGLIEEDLGNSFSPEAINNNSDVVGKTTTGMLYHNSKFIELNTISDTSGGWNLTNPRDINNKGDIVGYGLHNGVQRAFLLKPSPNHPVIIVPGIAGTYAADITSDTLWLKNRGVPPDQIQVDPLARVYNDLIKTLENVGYEKDKNLFVVNYDWRLTPGPIDNSIDGVIDGLTGTSISDDQFNYGVDYLGWYLKKASDEWRNLYNEELDSVDVIAHSTGGLLTRAYIQSGAYGDTYNGNHQLPKIRNFVMIGVPNRGASKAWNPLHDNWIADAAYRFVLSKIINRAYQKIKTGATIRGPDYDITLNSIKDSQGKPDSIKFINLYVPTIRYLLATYDFIDLGDGSFINLNNDPNQRNTFVLDLNNGYDLLAGANPNQFLDVTKTTVIYGNGESTPNEVIRRTDTEILAAQSFTEWAPHLNSSPNEWYKDIPAASGGDGTVPLESSVDQFITDNRANLILNSNTDHTGLVSAPDVQEAILKKLNVQYKQQDISTGSSNNFRNIINIISDPVGLFIIDGMGRKLGYSDSAGVVTEIPNSIWFGDKDGFGYTFDEIVEPVSLEVTGEGEDYYVMVSAEEQSKVGGIVLEGFLPKGEKHTYPIDLITADVEKTKGNNPDKFTLSQNYPNPFNPTTTINYSILQAGFVTIKVYDILGREVAILVNQIKAPGKYKVDFNANNLASGLYLYRLQAGSFVQTKKMILLR